ncbi:conserved hypothetical protein [Ricinus communis]|uniref:Uncharacterized protein n=1 Tax=Ricinus communis TaxID=3988 RepID=B9SIW3_RICCO|nr:conserved hypothetical protein [Ricinus communis]
MEENEKEVKALEQNKELLQIILVVVRPVQLLGQTKFELSLVGLEVFNPKPKPGPIQLYGPKLFIKINLS